MPNFGPQGMRYVGTDDVGNIHKVQVCTLMKYYPDQAVGSREKVSRHTNALPKSQRTQRLNA